MPFPDCRIILTQEPRPSTKLPKLQQKQLPKVLSYFFCSAYQSLSRKHHRLLFHIQYFPPNYNSVLLCSMTATLWSRVFLKFEASIVPCDTTILPPKIYCLLEYRHLENPYLLDSYSSYARILPRI